MNDQLTQFVNDFLEYTSPDKSQVACTSGHYRFVVNGQFVELKIEIRHDDMADPDEELDFNGYFWGLWEKPVDTHGGFSPNWKRPAESGYDVVLYFQNMHRSVRPNAEHVLPDGVFEAIRDYYHSLGQSRHEAWVNARQAVSFAGWSELAHGMTCNNYMAYSPPQDLAKPSTTDLHPGKAWLDLFEWWRDRIQNVLGFRHNEWYYVGIVVEAKRYGNDYGDKEVGYGHDSCWGFDARYGEMIADDVQQFIDTALREVDVDPAKIDWQDYTIVALPQW